MLGYVGGALALAAVIALLTAYWDDLGVAGQVGIGAVVAAAGLGGGFAMTTLQSAAAQRLRQFLLFIGVVGAGGAVGLLVNEVADGAGAVDPGASDWAWFAGLAAAAVVGGVIWWRNRTFMQHLAFGLGVGLGSVMVVPLLEPAINRMFPGGGLNWGAGAVLALVGLIWGYLGWKGKLPPDDLAWALASLGVLGGIAMMAFSPEEADPLRWALWLGAAVSVAMLVGGITARRWVLLGCGCGGTVLFVWLVVDQMFSGRAVVPTMLLSASVVFIALSVGIAKRGKPETAAGEGTGEEPPIPIASEVLGYVGGALAMAGAIALLTTFWDELGTAGRVLTPAVPAAITLAAGFAMGRAEHGSRRRLGQFLLVLGVAGVGAAGGLAVHEILAPPVVDVTQRDMSEAWGTTSGFALAAVAGGFVWFLRPGALTQLVFGVSATFGSMTVMELLPEGLWEKAGWLPGAMALAIAVPWFLLTLKGVMRPANTAYSVACAGILWGVNMLQVGDPADAPLWPLLLGVAVSVGMLAGSLPLKRAVLLGFGAAGVVVFSLRLVMDLFEGEIGGPIVLLIVGVLFIGLAVFAAVALPKMRGRKTADAGSESA